MRFRRLYKFLIIVLLITCYCSSGTELITETRLQIPEYLTTDDDSSSTGEKAGNLILKIKKPFIYSNRRFFIRRSGFDAASKIMNMAVDKALSGDFTEAEILMKELVDFISDGSVENNLAVIYEASRYDDEAFSMYVKAININTNNKTFRSNFLAFLHLNAYKKRSENKFKVPDRE